MPEFEKAVRELPINLFLKSISKTPGGMSTSELIRGLEAQGYQRRVILRVLQSQLDAGAIRLGPQMRLVVTVAEAA